MTEETWQLNYEDIVGGKKNYGRESLLTLGNGFFGWRGSLVTNSYDENFYPGLYGAGIFNKTTTSVSGQNIINEDLVNLPNPSLIKITINGQILEITNDNIKKIKRNLNFETGELIDFYKVQVDDYSQRFIEIKTIRVVDPIYWNRLGLNLKITSNFDADIVIDAIIDGSVENKNVDRYRDFDSKEFDIQSLSDDAMLIQTKTTNVNVAFASQTIVAGIKKNLFHTSNQVIEHFEGFIRDGESISIERVMSIASSLETNDNLLNFVRSEIQNTSFTKIKQNSVQYWQKFWKNKDIKISGDNTLQKLVRMNIFHLNQMANPNANPFLDVSVGSRGLTGEGYRGHIFWDELFVIPYYAANEPKIAKSLLKYRIKRLEAAKKNALFENELGAMYPWQSGMYGDEQSQLIHLNTVNNTWISDNSRLQRHVSLAIAYNMWAYQKITGRYDHLDEGGLDMLIQIGRFWINKAEKNGNKYQISGVMGPNEFHEEISGGNSAGLLNNAYTNVMVVWLLNYLDDLSKDPNVDFNLLNKLNAYTKEEKKKAQALRQHLKLSISKEGIVEQYEGFFKLKKIDFSEYKEKYGDIHRIDRLLKAEGKSPDDYQVIKQADFLMLLYNLGVKQTESIINQLGYQLPSDWLKKNTEYYLKRTTHGSTTSRPVFAGIFVELVNQGNNEFEKQAYDFLLEAIKSDFYDIQGGTTAEGIHIGVMGETLAVIQNNYAGVDLLHGKLSINPNLPEQWKRLQFTQQYHGALIIIDISQSIISLTSDRTISIFVHDKKINLTAGEKKAIPYLN
jgi:trehalose/maltose hydrolase-like predicted phosphorylase